VSEVALSSNTPSSANQPLLAGGGAGRRRNTSGDSLTSGGSLQY
jgi:hypothetical protein